jgi:hypothetical protein
VAVMQRAALQRAVRGLRGLGRHEYNGGGGAVAERETLRT